MVKKADKSKASGKKTGQSRPRKSANAPREKASGQAKAGQAKGASAAPAGDRVPRRSLVGKALYYGAVAGVWAVIVGVIALGYLAHDLPDLENLPHPGAGDPAILVKAANGATLVRQGPIYGDWVPYNEIPDALIWAFLAVEDRHFFSHSGFDSRGFLRAVYTNVKAGEVRAGGSTITQQLAKNMFLSNVRSFKRKAQELLLAFWLEQKFTKKQIFSLYLNRVYFGGGAYGVDAAARKYFGHDARSLSLVEAAMLAGVVQAPSRLAPHINPDGAWQRARVVLSAMVDNGAITEAASVKLRDQRPTIVQAGAGRDVRYFSDWVISRARGLLADGATASFIIHTTLDPSIQRAASLAVERGIAREGEKGRASQAALIAIDNDGALRAMVGGADYAKSQYNRAAQSARQPGSAFKIFPYIAALEAGVKVSDRYIDEPVTIDGWSPKNYSDAFNGEMTVREAFARSINTVAVKIAEQVGRDKTVAAAKRLGIKTEIKPVASLPLGTEEVRLIELAGAYAAIANGGFRAEPYAIVEITGLNGEVLYRPSPTPPAPVIDGRVAVNMADMMTSVIAWGSGKNARIDRPAAGKSGTSQDSRDAVFAGFTSDLTAAVWVGNDDGTPMNAVTGGGMPARIWGDFMIDAHAGAPVRSLLADAAIFRSAFNASPLEQKSKDLSNKDRKGGLWDRIFGNKE